MPSILFAVSQRMDPKYIRTGAIRRKWASVSDDTAIPLGDPPALPGRKSAFDSSGTAVKRNNTKRHRGRGNSYPPGVFRLCFPCRAGGGGDDLPRRLRRFCDQPCGASFCPGRRHFSVDAAGGVDRRLASQGSPVPTHKNSSDGPPSS